MASTLHPFRSFPGLGSKASDYLWSLILVLAVFALRLAMQPLFGMGQAYALMYPAVIVAAYLFGRGPAALATLVGGFVSVTCFIAPQFTWKAETSHLTSLLSFGLNCAVAVYVITALTQALRELSAGQSRAEAVANNHADLFRELNERISHQLRLVAGVLTLQAKGEPEADVIRSLQKASERSMLMARVHREMAGHTDAPIDFDAFARGLVRSVCQARGDAPDRVVIEPAGIWLPPEEATSLGVALAECVAALLARKDSGPLRVRMLGNAAETRLSICEVDAASGASLATLSSGYLLRAMVEQLGAAIALKADGEGASLEITVPRFPPPQSMTPAPRMAGVLH